MKKQITFLLGAEKQIKISAAGHSESLFYEGYRQALAGVVEIVRASSRYTRTWDSAFQEGTALRPPYCDQSAGPDGDKRSLCAGDREYYNFPNNFLIFTGGRGTGKSSAMLTFVDSLSRKNSQLFTKQFVGNLVRCELPGMVAGTHEEEAVDSIYSLLQDTSFLPLPPIDPTTLEEDGQILINILARMFQKAQETWEEGKRQDPCQRERSHAERRELNEKDQLMRQFTTCYESVAALRSKDIRREEFDGLNLLASLGDSSGLKKQLAELVRLLLAFCCPKSGENAYLVLQIDDTDMNVRHAYTILEDLRKYLMIPRLIIVMAADLNHLTQVVKSSFIRSYAKDLPNMGEFVRGITAQYVSKLIPQSRRIFLPEVGVYLREHPETEIRYMSGEDTILPDDSKEFLDSQDQIFRMIYRKTGMIFLRKQNHLHYIIPDNMRLLSHFLAMLAQMQNVVNPDDPDPGFFLSDEAGEKERTEHLANLQVRLQNVQRFRDYFMGVWVNNALREEHILKLRTLAEANLSNKTRVVCGGIDEDAGTSYADMVRLLRDKEAKEATEEGRKYIFAIHIYFSLLAHSIVLETLISHYEDPECLVSGSGKEGCTFLGLYPIFGSRLFSYVPKEIYWDLSDFGVDEVKDYEKVSIAANIRIMMEHTEPFPIRWMVPSELVGAKIEEFKQTRRENPKFLYSMLCPYQPPEQGKKVFADFTTPILNSLYLSQDAYTTPLAEWAVDNQNNTSGIEPIIWTTMQRYALMVVLNWDVQQKLGRFLQAKAAVFNASRLWPFQKTDLLTSLKGFYKALDKECARSETGGFPIEGVFWSDLSIWMTLLLPPVGKAWVRMTQEFYNMAPVMTGQRGFGQRNSGQNSARKAKETPLQPEKLPEKEPEPPENENEP